MFMSFTSFPLGTVTPGSATGTSVPGTAFGAPAMICSTRPPRSTWCTHNGLRDFGCGTCSSTLPITISDRSVTVSDSTSTPSRVSTSAASLGDTPARSTKSLNHSKEIFTRTARESAGRIRRTAGCRPRRASASPSSRSRSPRHSHSTAADFEPALVTAALAAHAGADAARDVELEARLGEREVARAHAHLAVAAVERLDHEEQRALQVPDREPLVHGQALDLAEVRQSSRLWGVAPVAAAGRDDVDGRLFDALHGANLHRRRVRPQQELRAEVERVPVLARGMADREVEGLEVVPLGLDLGALLDLVPEAFEHRLDLAAHAGEDVDVAPAQGRPREGDVDRLGLGDLGQARGLELLPAGGERRLDRALRVVGGLPEGGALSGLEPADARQQPADVPALAAQVLDRDGLQLVGGLGLRDGSEGLAGQRGGVAQATSLRRISNRISAAAAATLSDSTPSLRWTVTSFRSERESPWASLPRTIMSADSIGASARAAPPEAAAP